MNEYDLTFMGYKLVKEAASHQIWKNSAGQIKLLRIEATEELSHEDKIKKLRVGKPEKETKIILSPPKEGVGVKEGVKLSKIKSVLRETQAQKVDGQVYDEWNPELIRAYNDPQDVLNDDNATADMKDLAYNVLQLRMEDEENDNEEQIVEMILEKNVGDMTAGEKTKFHANWKKNKESIQSAQPSHEHVLNHYNQATDAEKHAGKNWYQDAHHLAKHVANDTKTLMHAMSGLLAVYSPQTDWGSNMMTAAKVARTKVPLGGKGEGVMASAKQKVSAGRILNGEHYDNIVKGHKIKAFGHLIEHGDNTPHAEKAPVVVDRHALSVSIGRRVNDTEFGNSGLKNHKQYQHVADQYRKAADHISQTTGEKVLPHHVQATTWLVRQRLNQAEDKGGGSASGKGKKNMNKWKSYRAEHHPTMSSIDPGVGYHD